ncbi:hypothetical protein RAB80_004596 [Fusarium oxysporum f. sp. vasinfectum]|nr:hypothetical protein RAB80_004596 [Fusarium oxysporum f. sp. vasinfectum]KAK2936061.1 hypothetical protein FoTM2_004005 [Fusarium oxysporum f. sp. vasinfectum]
MCKKATCGTCKKTSWWGCGSHIQSVIDNVPEAERCECEPKVDRAAALVLWTRGKKATWSPTGVVEEPL